MDGIRGLIHKIQKNKKRSLPEVEENLFTEVIMGQGEVIYPNQFQVGSGQSVGLQRDHNEDAIFTITTCLADGLSQIPIAILILADGMGGYQLGEVASSIAVRVVAKNLLADIIQNVCKPDEQKLEVILEEALKNAIQCAQEEVILSVPGSGTTLTVAVVLEQWIGIIHIGDSRAYVYHHDHVLERLTQDHTYVNHLVENGQISSEEAAVHPQRNVLIQAVGQMETLNPDFKLLRTEDGSQILVCSDGLWGVVAESVIVDILRNNNSPVDACQKLVAAANERGGPDNISVIICKV